MIKIITQLLFLTTALCWSQSKTHSFHVQILEPNYVPQVSHSKNGLKINSLNTFDETLNTILNSYKIYNVKKVSKDIYWIEFNNMNLLNDLKKSSFSSHYNFLNDNTETKHFPNDIGKKGGFIEIQEELNYIRAPEAWTITKGAEDIIIGISDTSVDPNHEELRGKTTLISGINRLNGSQHGTRVSSVAAAYTNNGIGIASIGYNSSLYNVVNNYVQGVDDLSRKHGVKVINTAWVNKSREKLYDEVINNRGVVVVGSAGNNNGASAGKYIYPAAFKDVISVGSIAHEDNSWTDIWKNTFVTKKDHHEIIFNKKLITQQHNDSIDILAPGFGILLAGIKKSRNVPYARTGGTSYASPFVSGTIALMFDVNYCLKPKEVESILKLTAVKVDHLPQNKKYYGKLGAGKLDAYKAVKMAKDMADPFGIVEIKDRILYRWFYKLETAPYQILMKNNDVTGNARLKFKARNRIKIKSGKYYPQKGGAINLSIDKELVLDNCTPRPSSLTTIIKDKKNTILLDIYPKSFTNSIAITKKAKNNKTVSHIIIKDLLGKELYKVYLNDKTIKLNVEQLKKGIYSINAYNTLGTTIGMTKIIKG